MSEEKLSKTEPKASRYVAVLFSKRFGEDPWDRYNADISEQPVVISETRFSGADKQSLGGRYACDSVENAKKYPTAFTAANARKLSVGLKTRMFDPDVATEASKEMSSADSA